MTDRLMEVLEAQSRVNQSQSRLIRHNSIGIIMLMVFFFGRLLLEAMG